MLRERRKAEISGNTVDQSTFLQQEEHLKIQECHRRDPKLMNHNSERKRKWRSKDFSMCQEEEMSNLRKKSYTYLRVS